MISSNVIKKQNAKMHTRISYPKNKKCHHVHSFRNYLSSQECTGDVGLAPNGP
uniref:Uncharacterized protein n=1 Tax=Siphoviridae sp. ctKgQ2 TaxID=2827842 RepID=A0A8S5TLS7_9CAUD|nr:MAG TPA: hypothetical protein [Siphoviridae sp. ctKgQ2]